MATFLINQRCVGCRGMIYSDVEGTLLGFIDVEPKYSKKNKVLNGTSKAKEVEVLCPACTAEMKKIVAGQKALGPKEATSA